MDIPPGAPRAGGAELLLVDNDATIVELLAFVLSRAGHRVRTARSLAEARVLVAERRPDLMLSDVELGAESALVELPRLAALGSLPPTLVVSGYLDAAGRAKLGGLREVLGFLDKPFDPRDLVARVGEALAEAAARARAEDAARPRASGAGWIEIGADRDAAARPLRGR